MDTWVDACRPRRPPPPCIFVCILLYECVFVLMSAARRNVPSTATRIQRI